MTPEIAENIIRLTMENGGGTFDHDGNSVSPDEGYAVGIHKGTYLILAPYDSGDLMYSAFRSLKRNFEGAFIGTWLDSDAIHVDPVMILQYRPLAEKVGRHFGQKAIYDFANKREIRL